MNILNFVKFFYDLVLAIHQYQREVIRCDKQFLLRINEKCLSDQVKGKKLFILGGARSINLLTDSNWEEIRSNISVGINNWLVHPFHPDFLMYEGLGRRLSREPQNIFIIHNLKKYSGRDSVQMLLKDIGTDSPEDIDVVRCHWSKFFGYPKLTIPASSPAELIFRTKLLRNLPFVRNIPLSSRISVVTAMGFAYKIGLREIVLCGVDLNSTDYFWEDEKFILPHELLAPTSGQLPNGCHSTMNERVSPITAEVAIINFVRNFLAPQGIKVSVASERSLLSNQFGVYKWST